MKKYIPHGMRENIVVQHIIDHDPNDPLRTVGMWVVSVRSTPIYSRKFKYGDDAEKYKISLLKILPELIFKF